MNAVEGLKVEAVSQSSTYLDLHIQICTRMDTGDFVSTILDIERLVESHYEIVDKGKPASNELIRRAENFLGVRFPKDYYEFVKRWGCLAIGPLEFYGITSENFESSAIPNAIWFTNINRKLLGLPHEYVVVYSNEGDEFYCLDTADTVGSRMIVWDTNSKQVTAVRSSSFFDFVLEQSLDVI